VGLTLERKTAKTQSTLYKLTVPTVKQIEQKRAYSIWGCNDIYITNDIKTVTVGLSSKQTGSRQVRANT
jgi:hypothetical protein